MIIVEVHALSLGRTYEFKLNEDVAANVIIEEISSVICQKEQCAVKGERSELLVLCDKQQILSSNLSLYENGVQSGDRLMLV